MSSGTTSGTSIETLADLLTQLGSIPPSRVRFRPLPGTATEQDVLDLHSRERRLYELLDGVLVEKAMGLRESFLASVLITLLWSFVGPRRLGLVTSPDGMLRLAPGLVRIPDVAFIAWHRLPGRRVPTEPIPEVIPNLAVEILSTSNTRGEMTRKRREYFDAGVELVWFVDPEARTVEVYTAYDRLTVLHEDDLLEGGEVLAGFTLSVRELFAVLDSQSNT